VGSYGELAPGRYAVSVRAAGSGSRTPPSLSTRIDVPSGGARTVALTGTFADLSLTVLTDDLSAPGNGNARVRVLDAAAGAPAVDVTRTGGPPLAQGLRFGAAGPPTTVPAGRSAVGVDGGPGGSASLPLDLPAGSVSTLLVLDRPDGGLTVRLLLDAAGPAAVPAGPVPAGAGGAAGTGSGLAVALLAAGAALGATHRRRAVLALVAALGAALLPAGPATAEVAPGPTPPTLVQPVLGAGGVPIGLRIPSAEVDTALSGISLAPDGLLVPPAGPAAAGWFTDGPVPGGPGPAVIAGHVDSARGPAVFFRLRDVAAGDPVLVTLADGSTVEFTVTRVARYAKDAFPTSEVYGPTPGAELRLITCGGEFDRARGSYADNLVVYAQVA
jgi:hypothetical protein